jgi:hypothetical protein
MRRAEIMLTFLAACGQASDREPETPAPAAAAATVAEATRDARFDAAVARIEAYRAALAGDYAAARTEAARAEVRAEARAYLIASIRDDLFPLWLGTPWGLGKNSTATRPHEPGMTVGCSYFVTSILGNAGFQLDDRYRFAQAPALDIQRSLARGERAVRRFLSIPATELAEKVATLPDGLWLIGLSNHVGWVRVEDGEVRFVHASWSGDRQVTDEDFATAHAIEVSRKAGYFVSPVIVDSAENDDLIDAWLRGATIPFRG